MYLDKAREAQADFGPRVHDGPIRRRNFNRQTFPSGEPKRTNIYATLISHLNAHSESVNALAVSPDHLFFISCSDDKTVKIWDTARLERNVTSKPRHIYGQHRARVKAICFLDGYHAFASAADDGSLHVVRVHINQSGSLPKYSKLQPVREHHLKRPGEYIQCMLHYTSGKEFAIFVIQSYNFDFP